LTVATQRRDRSLPIAGAILVVTAVPYVLLGNAVSHRPPSGIDAAARSIAGEAPRLAWILTESCLWPVLTTLGIAACLIAIRARAWRGRIVFAVVTTVVAWQTSNVLKDVFERSRPAYWLVAHETTFSYSSGHALFATVVYWLWAYHVARSTLRAAVRVPLCIALVVWGIGVIWSRLALGAHYPSDLVGGALLGVAVLALAAIVARVAAPRARIL
jgi:membrane-associated phospholipid phosphatase